MMNDDYVDESCWLQMMNDDGELWRVLMMIYDDNEWLRIWWMIMNMINDYDGDEWWCCWWIMINGDYDCEWR